ncbi:putative pectate lyase 4, partial [Bienertia sinuspersici]
MSITLPYSHVDSCLCTLTGQPQVFGRCAIGVFMVPFSVSPHFLSMDLDRLEKRVIKKNHSRLLDVVRKELSLQGREFEGGRGHDVDGIQIKPNLKHIWINRCTLCDYDDVLVDITRQSIDIFISRCHFSQHDKTMLIGADPSHVDDRCIRVTIHHCSFNGTRRRQPCLSFRKIQLYNNYTRDWGIYDVYASVESQIYSQCNTYEAGQKKTAFLYYTEM